MAHAKFATAEECKAHIATAAQGNESTHDIEAIFLTAFGYDGATKMFHQMLGEDGFYATIAQYEN